MWLWQNKIFSVSWRENKYWGAYKFIKICETQTDSEKSQLLDLFYKIDRLKTDIMLMDVWSK